MKMAKKLVSCLLVVTLFISLFALPSPTMSVYATSRNEYRRVKWDLDNYLRVNSMRRERIDNGAYIWLPSDQPHSYVGRGELLILHEILGANSAIISIPAHGSQHSHRRFSIPRRYLRHDLGVRWIAADIDINFTPYLREEQPIGSSSCGTYSRWERTGHTSHFNSGQRVHLLALLCDNYAIISQFRFYAAPFRGYHINRRYLRTEPSLRYVKLDLSGTHYLREEFKCFWSGRWEPVYRGQVWGVNAGRVVELVTILCDRYAIVRCNRDGCPTGYRGFHISRSLLRSF